MCPRQESHPEDGQPLAENLPIIFVRSRGIEPRFHPSEGCVLSIIRRAPLYKSKHCPPKADQLASIQIGRSGPRAETTKTELFYTTYPSFLWQTKSTI